METLFIKLVFVLLTIFLVNLLRKNIARFNPALAKNITIVVSVWLLFLTVFSFTPGIHDFSKVPPTFMIALLFPLVIILVLSTRTNLQLEKIPFYIPVLFQSFRIVMELILWALHKEEIIPVQMTFEGRNLDILTGITAIPVGLTLMKNKVNPKAVIAWNIGCLILLINIVVVAILSVPTPFRYFMNEPANTIITYWPFIWLPGFVVPMALLGHVISIKQMLKYEHL